jgi:hypothetical protein
MRQPGSVRRSSIPDACRTYRACANEPGASAGASTSRRWFVCAASYIRLTNCRSSGVS